MAELVETSSEVSKVRFPASPPADNNPNDPFLNVVSNELQSLQAVIEEANTRILKLQNEISSVGQRSPRLCGHAYSLTKRPPTANPDVPPEEATTSSLPLADRPVDRKATVSSQNLSVSAQETRAARNHARVTRVVADDPDLQGTENDQEQFMRIDTSKNGHLSAKEVTAIALTHGAQVTVASSIKAIQYVSARLGEDTSGQPEQGKMRRARSRADVNVEGELDLRGFLCLRSDPDLLDEAPDDLVVTLAALRRALEEESDQHMFETNKAKFNQRQRQAYLTEGLDVGIVLVIAVNAIVIGIGADNPQHIMTWEILEVVFFLIYLAECIVKNLWWGIKIYFCGPDLSWNLFDFGCLLVSAAELAVKIIFGLDGQSAVNLLKVLRLARLFRLVRIMRFKMFKELKLMAMGLLSGIRALSWAIVLLMVVIYTISIITKVLYGDHFEEFSTVPNGMFTLFRCFTEACEDYDGNPLPEQMYILGGAPGFNASTPRDEIPPEMLSYNVDFQIAYVLVTMLVTVGLFNLIMAVFIDNVTKSQNQRKQKELGETALDVEVSLKLLLARFINEPGTDKPAAAVMERFSDDVVNKLTNLTDTGRKRHQLEQRLCADEAFKLLKECNINITRDIFQAWLRDPEFVKVLEEADVDISNKFELFNILDVDLGGELSVHELLTGLMSLRGDVSKGDVIYILLRVRDMMDRLEIMQQFLEESIQSNNQAVVQRSSFRRLGE